MNENLLRKFSGRLGIRLSFYKSSAGWIEGPCPLARWTHLGGIDNRPSFALKISDTSVSSFVCKSCQEHGTLNKLAFRLAKLRNDTSLRGLADEIALAEIVGFTPAEFEDNSARDRGTPTANRRPLQRARGEVFLAYHQDPYSRAYLRQRNITDATALALGLCCDQDRGRVLFPIHDFRRHLRGFSGRAIELENIGRDIKSRWLASERTNRVKVRDYLGLPKRSLLLGEHKVERRVRRGECRRLILVEGLFGYARIYQENFRDVVALLGSTATKEKAHTLLRWGVPVVAMLDNDLAGQRGIYGGVDVEGKKAILGLVDYLVGKIPVLIPEWPEGKDDPDQLTRQEITQMIDNSEPYTY